MKMIIAGAGIGGLTTAIALARSGHSVQVLEQTPEPKPVGAGISLQPNAMRALATLELDQAISERGCAATIARLRFSNGRPVRTMDFSPYIDRYGYLPHTIHRSDLFDLLFGAATEAGVTVQFGTPLTSFQVESQSVSANTPDSQYHGDALIGADGINSRVRAGLFGEQPVRYSGYVCWRGIVNDPQLVSTIDTMNEWWGKGARCGFMPCSSDKVYWFATKTTTDRRRPAESWKAEFADWPQPVPELLESTPEAQIAFNEISDRKPIYPWSRGPITLLGDAAHPMTPNFGQGGAQAIEDAIVLGKAIRCGNDPATAFKSYQQHRHHRAKSFVNRSWQFGRVAQGGNVLWRMIRNHLLPLVPESAMTNMMDDQFNVGDHLSASLS